MRHYVINANPNQVPYFEWLYEKKGYNFAMQYGNGAHYLITTDDKDFYDLVEEQKGARQLNQDEVIDAYQAMNGCLWLGNEILVRQVRLL